MIKLKVTGQNIKVSCCDAIASDAIDVIKVNFEFDSMWDGMYKAAQFTQCVDKASGETHTYSTVVTDTSSDGLTGEALLPNEIGVGQVRVSVFGVNATENTRLTTIPVVLDIRQSGFVPDGETPIPPTEDLYTQFVERLDNVTSETKAYANDAAAAALRAEQLTPTVVAAEKAAQEALDKASEALPMAEEAIADLANITETVRDMLVEETADAAAAAEAANMAAANAEAALDEIQGDIDSITARLDDLEYVEIAIQSFTLSQSSAEMGSTIDALTLKYALNKAPKSLKLDGVAQDEAYLVASGSLALSGLGLTTNKTYTLAATDNRDATATKTAVLSFLNGAYYGVGKAATIDSAFVLGLTKVLTSTKTRTITVNAGEGQYIWYAIPTRFGTPTFTVGGFTGGFTHVTTIAFTNASGYTENYAVYQSDNASLGSTEVVIK